MENSNQIHQQLRHLQVTLDNIGAYVFTKDLQGRYTYVNQLVCELFECTAEEILGRDDSEFFELSIFNELRKNDQTVMQKEVVIEAEEKTIIAKTGAVKYYKTVKKPLYDDEQNIIGMLGVSTDISEQKELEFQLTQKQNLLDTVLNNVNACIYMKDRDYRFSYINSCTAELFGTTPDAVVGKNLSEVFSQEVTENFIELDSKVFESGVQQSAEEVITTPDGIHHSYWSTKVPIKDCDGEIRSYIGISTDITELRTIDSLTGIKNRRVLDIELNNQFSIYKRYGHEYSLILGDVDYFKKINDNYGHAEGDKVLKLIAQTLTDSIRETDILGRWGGEEFVLICPDTRAEQAGSLAEKLRKSIEVLDTGLGHVISISFGVAQIQATDTDSYAIVNHADQQMYQAKSKGRNQVSILTTP